MCKANRKGKVFMKHNLGKTLAQLRNQNNMSQEELAQKLNISRQAISNWERNITQPDIYTLQNISTIFNVEINDILNAKSLSLESNHAKQRQNLSAFLYLINAILSIAILIYILTIHKTENSLIGLCFLIMIFVMSTIIFITFESLLSKNNLSLIDSFTRGMSLNKHALKKLLHNIELFYLASSLALSLLVFMGIIFHLAIQYHVFLLFIHIINFIIYVLFINLKLKEEIQLKFDTIEVKNQYKNLFITLIYAVVIITTPFVFFLCISLFDIKNKTFIILLLITTIILNLIGLFYESYICTKHIKANQKYIYTKYTIISIIISLLNLAGMIIISYLR